MKRYIEMFMQNLSAMNYSEVTIKNYSCDLEKFLKFVFENELSLETIKISHLNEYVLSLSDLSPATRGRHIASIRSFYRFLEKNELITLNPASKLETPKLAQKVAKTLDTSKIDDILTMSKILTGINHIDYRNYCIMALLLNTGIRREEVTSIKLIDVTQNSIIISGKGNKQRIVFINDSLKPVIRAYIEVHRACFASAKDSEYLFISKQAGKLSVGTVHNIVSDTLEASGCKNDGVSVHITRKTFATEAYKNTGDIYAVSEILGHSNVNTTRRYVKRQEDKAYAACSVNF